MTCGNPDDYWLERGKPRFPWRPGVKVLGRTQISTLRVFLAVLLIGLVTVAPAASAPPVPNPLGPPDGTEAAFLPTFAWQGVSGADKYQFELAADAGFNSKVYTVTTKNTRAAADKTAPNGTYFWRVASVDAAGNVSNWSPTMTVEKLWAGSPSLQTPADGATISYPADPLILRWATVPGAAKYRVFVATDSSLGSLLGGAPVETQARNYVPPQLLASTTYYWAVTPLDAQGNPGDRSPIRSFTWEWPSATSPVATDLEATTELFNPEFSWDPVPGAARYEVEINSTADFESGSKKCCTLEKPITTSFTPSETLENNTYYWRVRAVNSNSSTGQWNEGESFDKTFDNYPDLSELSIKNLRMRDTSDPGTDTDGELSNGYQTELPILTWDPVPGAASYEVDVVPYDTPAAPNLCDWGASSFNRWTVKTASISWTPLGWGILATAPYGSSISASKDQNDLVLGESYCARVRARGGRLSLGDPVWGDYMFLDDGTGNGTSFEFAGFTAGGACSPSCNANYLGAEDYTLPIRGETVGRMPLFTWNPIAGKEGYWVIVAKDPSFSVIVDYAFTRIPAYAVRTASQPRTYADETTAFYWVVLPSNGTNGSGAPGNPSLGAYSNFHKQTDPPALISPPDATAFSGPPRFQWTSSEGARRYHLQVADEPTFGDPLADERTASTAFTALEQYPSAGTLYWRVQAEDENNIGLTWSDTGTFEIDLPAPELDPANVTAGDGLPVVSWEPVPGAISYDIHVQEPDGDFDDFGGFPSTAASWLKMTGVGIFTWQVRAEFPKGGTGKTPGPWSETATYTRTIQEPQAPTEDVGTNKLVLSWQAKTGVKNYKVQVSAREDFSPYIESKTTDNPSFAPAMTSLSYKNAATLYWRVAAVDADSNVGDWTTTRSFDWPGITTPAATLKTFSLSTKGYFVKSRYKTVYLYAKDSATLLPVSSAAVRVSGCGLLTTKFTNSSGAAKFYLKATKTGTATFRVSRSGYATKYIYRKCRLP
jgi:hypothetical protein